MSQRKRILKGVLIGVMGVGAAGAAVVAAPLVIAGVGFGAGGIAAGSLAASMMSTAATTGFGMAAVSVLQSAGAAGLAVSTNLLIGAAAGAAGAGISGVILDKSLTEGGEDKGSDNPEGVAPGEVDKRATGSEEHGTGGVSIEGNPEEKEPVEESNSLKESRQKGDGFEGADQEGSAPDGDRGKRNITKENVPEDASSGGDYPEIDGNEVTSGSNNPRGDEPDAEGKGSNDSRGNAPGGVDSERNDSETNKNIEVFSGGKDPNETRPGGEGSGGNSAKANSSLENKIEDGLTDIQRRRYTTGRRTGSSGDIREIDPQLNVSVKIRFENSETNADVPVDGFDAYNTDSAASGIYLGNSFGIDYVCEEDSDDLFGVRPCDVDQDLPGSDMSLSCLVDNEHQ